MGKHIPYDVCVGSSRGREYDVFILTFRSKPLGLWTARVALRKCQVFHRESMPAMRKIQVPCKQVLVGSNGALTDCDQNPPTWKMVTVQIGNSWNIWDKFFVFNHHNGWPQVAANEIHERIIWAQSTPYFPDSGLIPILGWSVGWTQAPPQNISLRHNNG